MPWKISTLAAFRFCRASLVALRGRKLLLANPQANYKELLPRYLRRPEAERLADERMQDHIPENEQ